MIMTTRHDIWLKSTRIVSLHIIIMCVVGAALTPHGFRSPAWIGAAVVALIMTTMVVRTKNSRNRIHEKTRWSVIMLLHLTVVVGIVAVIVGARSIKWVMAATGVALLLAHIQHSTYAGCVLHDVERIFGRPSFIDTVGLVFVPGRYDPSDREHATLVTGGVMATTLSFALIKLVILMVSAAAS